MAEGEDCVSVILPETFERAAKHIKTLVAKLDSNQLLELYAYYKQVKEGPCNIPRPRWYEMQAKQKWEAWYGLGEMDRETAMKRYIAVISELDPGWDTVCSDDCTGDSDVDHSGNRVGWVAVSCMSNTDEYIADNDKTIFDWVKEGNVDKVLEHAQSLQGTKFVNNPDSEGMGLIHWAADRGNVKLLQCLVGDLKADVNLKDQEGQTALHYAASCGHVEIVRFLLDHGADPNLKDGDGMLPIDVASDREIEKALGI